MQCQRLRASASGQQRCSSRISKPCRPHVGRTTVGIRIRCQAGTDQQPAQPAAPVSPPVPQAPAPAPGPAPYAPYAYEQPYQSEYVVRSDQAPMPPQQRQYEYYAPPPMPMYAPPPVYKEAQASSGLPWFIWVGIGIVGATAFSKISELVKKGPQQVMAEMAMKQMMGAMSKQPGGAGAANPFGAGSPFGGAAPGAGFGVPPNFGGASPFPGYPPPPTPQAASSTVDTTFTNVQQADAAGASGKGEKFSSRLASEGRAADTPQLDVVEAEVKEPPPMGTPSPSSSAKRSFFQDVDVTAQAAQASTPPPFPQFAGMPGGDQGAGAGAAPGVGKEEEASAVTAMMEKMLRNPEMQKMLYPYLPEPMRNPSSIEWMLNNPEVKKQMEMMLTQQGFNMPPNMVDMMKNMDMSEEKMNAQFQELGLKPEDVISRVMSNPELASGFQSPKVQQAILDISANPMNIVKYQNDPEVMKVLEKVNEIFAPNVQGMAPPQQ